MGSLEKSKWIKVLEKEGIISAGEVVDGPGVSSIHVGELAVFLAEKRGLSLASYDEEFLYCEDKTRRVVISLADISHIWFRKARQRVG